MMKGGEEFLMALKSNERLSFSLTHSPLLFQFSSSRPPPPPLDSSFSLIDEPPATTDRSFQLSIHPCFLPVCSTVNYIPVNFFPSSSSEQTIETRRECTFGIVVFFFFFIILDFSRIIFSFVRKRCVSFYFLKQSTLSIPREKSKESISDRSLLRYSYSMHRDGCVSRYHLKT